MKKISLIQLVFAVLIAAAPVAAHEGTTYTVLLPFAATSRDSAGNTSSDLRISDDDSKPEWYSTLQFDLSPIPPDATITGARLRMVAGENSSRQQTVRVFLGLTCPADLQGKSLGFWTIFPYEQDPVPNPYAGERVTGIDEMEDPSVGGLRDAIVETLKGDKILSLCLASRGGRADWTYGSLGATHASEKPRLIVTYTLPAADPPSGPTGDRTDWKFYAPSPTFAKVKIATFAGGVISGPMVYEDQVVVIARRVDGEGGSSLYSLSTTGAQRWTPVPTESPGVHSVVDRTGRLYNFGKAGITVYDLEHQGKKLTTVPYTDTGIDDPGSVLPAKTPTVTPGGNLFFVRSGTPHIYALSPFYYENAAGTAASMRVIWRSDRVGSNPTRVIVSPPGPDFLAYTLSRKETAGTPAYGGLFALDAATGQPRPVNAWTAADKDFTNFHNPVLAPAGSHDYAILAGYKDADGGLLAVKWLDPGEDDEDGTPVSERAWATDPPQKVSQPALAPAAKPEDSSIVLLQGGVFQHLGLFDGTPRGTSVENRLAATSNIVLDGEGTACFWNDGTIYAYAAPRDGNCNQVVQATWPAGGLPEYLTLLYAADGTLIVRDRPKDANDPRPNKDVYALHRVASADLTVSTGDLKDNTIYAAPSVTLTSPSGQAAQSPKRTVLIKAGNRISFARGFRWPKNSELRTKVYGTADTAARANRGASR